MTHHVGYYNAIAYYSCIRVLQSYSSASRKFESLKFLMRMDHTSAVTRDGYDKYNTIITIVVVHIKFNVCTSRVVPDQIIKCSVYPIHEIKTKNYKCLTRNKLHESTTVLSLYILLFINEEVIKTCLI